MASLGFIRDELISIIDRGPRGDISRGRLLKAFVEEDGELVDKVGAMRDIGGDYKPLKALMKTEDGQLFILLEYIISSKVLKEYVKTDSQAKLIDFLLQHTRLYHLLVIRTNISPKLTKYPLNGPTLQMVVKLMNQLKYSSTPSQEQQILFYLVCVLLAHLQNRNIDYVFKVFLLIDRSQMLQTELECQIDPILVSLDLLR